MSNQDFFVDEFFAPEIDEGKEITITVAGKDVPITVRTRGVTNEDRMAAELAATTVTMKNGKVDKVTTDRAKASMELAARQVLSWPFKDRETGEMLPITGANLARMRGGADEIIAAAGQAEAARDESVAPFVEPSAAD